MIYLKAIVLFGLTFFVEAQISIMVQSPKRAGCDSLASPESSSVRIANPRRRVEGTETGTFSPVSSIEDGSSYMIRNVCNNSLCWDMVNGSLSNGTKIQLYSINYSQAQKFTFKKQFDYSGQSTFRLSPLFAYEKVLSLSSENSGTEICIGDETYNDSALFLDKFIFTPISGHANRFTISVAIDSSLKHIGVENISSGSTLKLLSHASQITDSFVWEILKTDYLGLHVGNKVQINGTNETRFVARAPYAGQYIVETMACGTSLDTYLSLIRDSDGQLVSSNDDSGEGLNARITYSFPAGEDFSVKVRGYSSSTTGPCYLIFRPVNSVYLCGTYDIDNQHIDRISSLNSSKPYIRQLGLFPYVYGNLGQSRSKESDWQGSVKMARDHYLFYGHGSDGHSAVYFNGDSPDWLSFENLPNLSGAYLVTWMICDGAKDYVNNGYTSSMVHESVVKGAQYSLGFEGEIYNITCDSFIPKLYESLSTLSLVDSIAAASNYAMSANWFWWTFWGNWHCVINQPVLHCSNGSVIYPMSRTNGSINVISESQSAALRNSDQMRKNGIFWVIGKDEPIISSEMAQKAEATKNDLEKNGADINLFAWSSSKGTKIVAMCNYLKEHACLYIDIMSGKMVPAQEFEQSVRPFFEEIRGTENIEERK